MQANLPDNNLALKRGKLCLFQLKAYIMSEVQDNELDDYGKVRCADCGTALDPRFVVGPTMSGYCGGGYRCSDCSKIFCDDCIDTSGTWATCIDCGGDV